MSKQVMDEFELMRLVFASMATPTFETIRGDIGYTWRPEYGSKEDKENAEKGIAADSSDIQGTKWLEFQVRRTTNALRSIDKYYQPPGIQYAMAKYY